MKSTFRALRSKKFSALMFGQTLSRIGDFLFQIAGGITAVISLLPLLNSSIRKLD